MPRRRKNQTKEKLPAAVIVLFAALIIFFLFVSVSSFRDSLFNFLFPKPQSKAAGIVSPTKLAVIYRPPQYPNGTLLTATEVNQKFQTIIATPDSSSWSGFTSGPFMYYVLFDQTEGPPGLNTVFAQTQTCDLLDKDTYVSNVENSVTTFYHGEFCQIHDNIITNTEFDHDLNPSTSMVVASENWFLHDINGVRLTFNQGTTVYYAVNPGNSHWREYFIARLFRDLNFNPGDAINERGWISRVKATGIFLDNVGLSWGNLKNKSNNKLPPREFATTADFTASVVLFIQQIHSALHNGYNYPLWANLVAGYDTGSDWDQFAPYLEGAMKEDFALNWGSGPYAASIIENQLTQAEKWISTYGDDYIAIGRARYDTQANTDFDTRFSLAAYLLITDGNKGFYKVRTTNYSIFNEYPEYYYQLGRPLEVRQKISDNPRIYRRNFECGYVELNLTVPLGTISYTTGCVPGVTATPTPIPTLAFTPTPTIIVTSTPSPSPTKTPTPTPNIQSFIISNVEASNPTSSSALISWTSSQPGTSWVEYGTSSLSLTNKTLVNSSLVTSHSVSLTGLSKSTKYYYRVHSADSAGVDHFSLVYNFRTKNR